MEDVVWSFRRRCAARRIAAGWQKYNNRKQLRQNLATIRRCARNHIRRANYLRENAALLATCMADQNPSSVEPSVGDLANCACDVSDLRVLQKAAREVLTLTVLIRDPNDEDVRP